MKKVLTIGLVVFIICIGLYFTLRYFANIPDENNWFNENWRAIFDQSPAVRDFFNLHRDGDGRSDYFRANPYSALVFEVDGSDGCAISDAVFDQVEQELDRVIDKPAGMRVLRSDTIPLLRDAYTADEIRTLAHHYRNKSTQGSEAVLQVLCLNSYAGHPSNVGLTVFEDGVVIFDQAINKLKLPGKERDRFVASTILHEIGHQLGLGHIDNPRCIMSETVEVPVSAHNVFLTVPYRWCEEELSAFTEIRQDLP